jgi:hypothetical protein
VEDAELTGVGDDLDHGAGMLRAYSPVLRHASLPGDTTVPWWDGRQLRFEFA